MEMSYKKKERKFHSRVTIYQVTLREPLQMLLNNLTSILTFCRPMAVHTWSRPHPAPDNGIRDDRFN